MTATSMLSLSDLVESIRVLALSSKEKEAKLRRILFSIFYMTRSTWNRDDVPSLGDVMRSCTRRVTDNDIDYTRAFFPLLGLTWRFGMTREQGMREIYDSQRTNAARLIMMHGSPRTALWPGWAPSYLTNLGGKILDENDPIAWKPRGLQRTWMTSKVASHRRVPERSAMILDQETEPGKQIRCGCLLSKTENELSIAGFGQAVNDGNAFIISVESLVRPPGELWAINALPVERVKDLEQDVFLTVAVTDTLGIFDMQPLPWLIRHESPISTDDTSGRGFAEIRYLLGEEHGHDDLPALLTKIQEGNADAVKNILKNTDDLDVQDQRGWRPLHHAACKNDPEISRLLLCAGASVDAQDNDGRTAAIIAADKGHNLVLEEPISFGANVQSSCGGFMSAINQAVTSNHLETARLLLDHGVDPNLPDDLSFTPLLFAVQKPDIAALLLEKGANPRLRHSSGTTTLHFAARGGNVAVADLLLEAGIPIDVADLKSPQTPMYHAIMENHEDIVRTLLRHNANVETVFEGGWTPILLAAKTGNIKTFQMLHEAGAKLDARTTGEGWTPLNIATQNGHRIIVKFLLKIGAIVTEKNASGKTPRELAVANGHTYAVNVLIDAEEEVTGQVDEGFGNIAH